MYMIIKPVYLHGSNNYYGRVYFSFSNKFWCCSIIILWGIIILLTISEYVIKTSVYSKKIGNILE